MKQVLLTLAVAVAILVVAPASASANTDGRRVFKVFDKVICTFTAPADSDCDFRFPPPAAADVASTADSPRTHALTRSALHTLRALAAEAPANGAHEQ